MSRLDEERLAAHLARRSTPPTREVDRVRDDRLTAAVARRIADHPQAASWRLRLSPWSRTTTSAGAMLAVGLVAIVSLSGLLSHPPASSQGPNAETGVQVLTAAELSGLVSPSRVSALTGRVVIVDADIEEQAIRCLFGAPCAIGSIVGSNPPVLVYTEDMAGKVLPTAAPLALRIRDVNSVDLVGHVRRPTTATEIAWELPAVIDELERIKGADRGVPANRLVPALFAVDAWLSGAAFPPRCRATVNDGPFACGLAAWLTPSAVQPNTVTANTYGLVAPEGGIRVQNDAYAAFAPATAPVGDPPIPAPARAVYLVRPLVDEPSTCFVCPSAGAVELVARLDAVKAPPEATPPNATSPDATPDIAAEVSIVNVAELQELMSSDTALGHVVIADVLVRTDLTFDCDGECPFGYIDGSDPMIGVYGLPLFAAGKPLALRIRAGNGVDLLGNVLPPGSSGSTWTVPEFLDGLPPPGSESGLFAIDGWLSAGLPLPCPAPIEPTPQPDFDFGCGRAAFLGPTDAQPVDGHAPGGSLRAQNNAYATFAAHPDGFPARAVYLVDWLVRVTNEGSCFECPDGPLLHIVVRVEVMSSP